MISLNSVLNQLASIQERLSVAQHLTESETQSLREIFDQVQDVAISLEDRNQILSLRDRVTQEPQIASLNTVFQILLRNCPDNTIAHFLGLDTWQSGGQIDRAKTAIIQCFKTQGLRLNLMNMGLTSLPAGTLKWLTHLQELNCSVNPLSSLPDEIGLFTNLRKLNCINNQLISLPASIGQLTELRELYCMSNQLTTLPASIGLLTKLQKLFCSGNQLTTLPIEIGQLTQLQNLNCGFNLFTTVPLALSSLIHADIDFGNNRISMLPPELTHLNINLGRQIVIQQPNNIPRPSSFNTLKSIVSDRRQDLKSLELPKLQGDECWINVSLWLDKLAGSADCTNTNTRSLFAERVLSILMLAEENEEYRAALNATLSEALSTCIDRATFYLCTLETRKAILESSNGTLSQMLKVLKGAFAVEWLDACANQLVVKLRSQDPEFREDLEVHLALLTKLKKEFSLPIGVEDMNYLFCARLKQSDFAAVRKQVHIGLQDHKSFVEFLLQQETWTEKLKKDFPEERGSALAKLDQEMISLDDKMFAGTMTNEESVRFGKLPELFKAAEKKWLKAKTQELCQNPVERVPEPSTCIIS